MRYSKITKHKDNGIYLYERLFDVLLKCTNTIYTKDTNTEVFNGTRHKVTAITKETATSHGDKLELHQNKNDPDEKNANSRDYNMAAYTGTRECMKCDAYICFNL